MKRSVLTEDKLKQKQTINEINIISLRWFYTDIIQCLHWRDFIIANCDNNDVHLGMVIIIYSAAPFRCVYYMMYKLA